MHDVKQQLIRALERTLADLGVDDVEVTVQEVPADKPGDYGSPVAFGLARRLRRNPAELAREVVAALALPPGVAAADAVGPYINVTLDPGPFVRGLTTAERAAPRRGEKVVVEHTSVNPNKEAHVGHLRNVVLGDATARILRADGYEVEVHNYIDDTGRQAAETLYAIDHFGASYDGSPKYDHWLGRLYVRLGDAKASEAEVIERGVSDMMHRLERGEMRSEIAAIVRAQLETFHALGAEYDLLVWESDVVASGFLERGLDVLRRDARVRTPTEGKYAGALVMDVSAFIPGLEESDVVLVRSDGNAMYVAKDIGYQFWKVGIFEGLGFERFSLQPSGAPLYSSAPGGDPRPDGRTFGHADAVVNVIDVRQSHPQTIVRTALKFTDAAHGHEYDRSHHLAYEVVTLEGQPMSGRKGITLSIDEALAEAVRRARSVIAEKNPELGNSDTVAHQVGLGALRFAMVRSEARRIIDFRWEQALSLQGDSAPYVQYAHARARSILRAAALAGIDLATVSERADWDALGPLEVGLAQVVARLPEVTAQAARDYAPHLVAQYALDLATAWNSYYNHKDAQGRGDTVVLRSPAGLREARLALVVTVADTLAAALDLLGIAAPEEM